MSHESSFAIAWLRACIAVFSSSIRRLMLTWQSAICLIVLGMLSGLALL